MLEDYKPDFENLKNILLCRSKNPTPLIELHIDKEFKEKYLSRELLCLQDEIEFSLKLGHDFILVSKGILDPGEALGGKKDSDEVSWAEEGKGKINSIKDIDNYDWPDPEKEDYSVFLEAESSLPEGMKILATGGKIFTASWMLSGFDNFCISTIENSKLIKRLINKVGEIQFRLFKKIIGFNCVGAFAVVDDIAYTEGLMISSKILRKYLFPWYKKMGKLCNKINMPFIFHSDGRILDVIDDLLECGFNAIHPIEPKAMDIIEIYEKYKKAPCLLGNIEVDTLIRGEPIDIKKLVSERLNSIAKDGFYACGSSNSITKKMPISNIDEMVKTVIDARHP